MRYADRMYPVQVILAGPGNGLPCFAQHLRGNPHRKATGRALRPPRNANGRSSVKEVVDDPMQGTHSKKARTTTKAKAKSVSIARPNAPSASSNGSARRQGTSRRPTKKGCPSGAARLEAEHTGPARSVGMAEGVDIVSGFLKEVGLSPALTVALKEVGITDAARMRALGSLSETVLDRLESSLGEAGLDIAARLLVREGLKQRAARPL